MICTLLLHEEALPLTEVFELYIYDICYGFFDASGPAYSLENEVEVEIDLSSGAEHPGSQYSVLAPSSLLRVARYFRRAFIIPFHEEMPTGEIAPNLHHVAQHYDDLPDFMMFIHADVYEHVEVSALVSVLNSLALRLWPRELPFVHLGRRHNGPTDASGRVASELRTYCRMRAAREGSKRRMKKPSIFRGDSVLERCSARTPSGWYCQWVELAWELLFDSPPQLPQDDYGGYDYGQFVASRQAAQSRPKAFWQKGWRALCSGSNYRLLPGTSFVSWKDLTASDASEGARFTWHGFHKGLEMAFEHLWHVIFNPRASSWLWPSRLRDPSLPLGLKFAMPGNPALLRFYRWTPHDPL
ncbi:unnamed protein product [Symbiodinium natans]|uniref:Uncharacterized protein n=1 Tax=Symbiodinium natans TaxID=878477 RepID=A0A812RPE0_9DINO|nr:unnamed protein product [Symbiodinium natans]